MKTVAARILRLFGFRAVLTANAVIAALSIAAIALIGPATPHAVILALLLVGGCFRSLQFTSLNAIAYAEVSNREMSYATSLQGVAQQLSLSAGVALGAAVLEGVGRAQRGAGLRAEDFAPAFVAVALVSALSALVMARLDPNAGAEMAGRQAVAAKQMGDAS